MKLAVVKPDHLGDLVLASAAVRALTAAHPDLTLFVSTHSLGLARWLFPTLELRAMDLSHLAKADAEDAQPFDLRDYDEVAFLRRDGVMTPQWADLRTRRHVMFVEDHEIHQSLLDYGVVREFAPPYDIDAHFFADGGAGVAEKAQRRPQRVGLSIGSGFYTNVWPLVRWVQLAKMLVRRNTDVRVVCGPAEVAVAHVLLNAAGLDVDRLIVGGADFAAFSNAVDELDLVVASDGGTAHLCSLTTPVLSIFGSSPLRRYAPFGRMNSVISQKLNCSPCFQYSARLVNGCASIECMAAITADDVLAAMDRAHDRRLTDAPVSERLRPGLTMLHGVSHLGREAGIAAREQEAARWRI